MGKMKHQLNIIDASCVFWDQVRLCVGLFLIWQHNLICMHLYKDNLNATQSSKTDPCPLWQMLIIDIIVLKPMKCQHLVDKEIERWNCFELEQGCILPKQYFGVRCALTQTWVFFFLIKLHKQICGAPLFSWFS